MRDGIEDRLGEFDDGHRSRLANLDETLASKHERVADILPSAAQTERKRWWWFLHEGPEVRPRAPSG